MSDNDNVDSVASTVTFQLVKLGQLAKSQLADRLAPLGLRPRHCGVLELLKDGPMAQLDLANGLGVAPSVIVDMIDELQDIGAVDRVRSSVDRRRQFVDLTTHGRSLAQRAAMAARALDADLLGDLDTEQCARLRTGLGRASRQHRAEFAP
jgi:DNA-binding MarR family transcriptional regulator